MAATSRREKLEVLLADDPNDPFLRYGIAIELDKEGRHDESLSSLVTLAREKPPYVPAYFMAGQQYARLSRVSEARAILREGIEAARTAHNHHAAGEMSEFLASLGQLGD